MKTDQADSHQGTPLTTLHYSVTLSVLHGSISLPRVTHSLEFIRGSGFLDASVTFRGDLRDAYIALTGVLYRPDVNFNYRRNDLQRGRVGVA